MNATTRTILIALGVTLLVVVLVPLFFMMGMMVASPTAASEQVLVACQCGSEDMPW